MILTRNDRQTILQFATGSLVIAFLLMPTVASARSDREFRELPNFHRVGERLYRGAQPRDGGIKRLAELGINTIINLRGPDERIEEERAEALSLGMKYFSIPFPSFSRPSPELVDKVLQIILAPDSGRVFVHCKQGADRTGTIIACYRILSDGWALKAALDEARRFGLKWMQFGMKDFIRDFAPRHAHETESTNLLNGILRPHNRTATFLSLC